MIINKVGSLLQRTHAEEIIMFNFFNKTDSDVKRDVLNELMWDPSVTAPEIKVSVRDGIVSLSGSVPHYIEKVAAEHAAQRVGGVKAVADELTVKGEFDKSDQDVAQAALNALQWNYSVPKGVKVSVDNGWINLSGEVSWDYQRNAAVKAVRGLLGVVGVTNDINIKPTLLSSDIKIRIEEALKRSAEIEGREIGVLVSGNKVTLSGHVHSISEREDARFAAWNTPGVMTVENNLTIFQ
jgi:osmotically-inducible protein OsmY